MADQPTTRDHVIEQATAVLHREAREGGRSARCARALADENLLADPEQHAAVAERDQARAALESTQAALRDMEQKRDAWKVAAGVDFRDLDVTPDEARAMRNALQARTTQLEEQIAVGHRVQLAVAAQWLGHAADKLGEGPGSEYLHRLGEWLTNGVEGDEPEPHAARPGNQPADLSRDEIVLGVCRDALERGWTVDQLAERIRAVFDPVLAARLQDRARAMRNALQARTTQLEEQIAVGHRVQLAVAAQWLGHAADKLGEGPGSEYLHRLGEWLTNGVEGDEPEPHAARPGNQPADLSRDEIVLGVCRDALERGWTVDQLAERIRAVFDPVLAARLQDRARAAEAAGFDQPAVSEEQAAIQLAERDADHGYDQTFHAGKLALGLLTALGLVGTTTGAAVVGFSLRTPHLFGWIFGAAFVVSFASTFVSGVLTMRSVMPPRNKITVEHTGWLATLAVPPDQLVRYYLDRAKNRLVDSGAEAQRLASVAHGKHWRNFRTAGWLIVTVLAGIIAIVALRLGW